MSPKVISTVTMRAPQCTMTLAATPTVTVNFMASVLQAARHTAPQLMDTLSHMAMANVSFKMARSPPNMVIISLTTWW